MAITFEGETRHMHLSSGTTALDVRDLYSRWKDWVRAGNAGWEPAFACVGGDEISPGVFITTYAFLINGWRVHPQEADHKLTVAGGVLLTVEGDDPIIPTFGTFNVLVQYSQPIKTETVATGSTPPVDINALVAAVWALVGPSGHSTMTSLESAAADAAAANAGVQATDVKVDALAADLAAVKQVDEGRWKIANNQMTFYAADGLTPLLVFNLKDAAGQPTMTDVFERVPV